MLLAAEAWLFLLLPPWEEDEDMEVFGVVNPGPEGSEEFSNSRCSRSKIGGGISLRSRASSTSP